MANKKKGLLLAAGAVAAIVLAGCGGGGGTSSTGSNTSGGAVSSGGGSGTLSLSIWCPSTDNDYMSTIITNFKEDNPEYATADIRVIANPGEGEVANLANQEQEATADVFCLADDNIRQMVEAEMIAPLTDEEVATAIEENGEDAVDAGRVDETAYGFPYRNDNGYVLYYDSSIITPTQASTLEGILAACQESGSLFYYEIADSWYTPSFLTAVGGKWEINADGDIVANFLNETVVQGVESFKTLYDQYRETWVVQEALDAGDIDAGLQEGAATRTGAFICWNHYDDAVALNEDIECAPLPTFNGQALRTFLGYKHVGVKSETLGLTGDRAVLAKEFAAYLTNQESQQLRRDTLGHGVTNLVVNETPYTDNPHLTILNEMFADGATIAQGVNVTADFWDPVKSIGQAIYLQSGWGEYTGGAADVLGNVVNQTGWVSNPDL